MAEDSIFERLITLPLFQGMSRSDLQAITGHTRFDFKKHTQGDMIVEEGTPCQHLYFLLAGAVYVTTEADDHGYQITEDQKAPAIFQLENIFGLNQRFTHSYTAREDSSLMSITKQEVIQLVPLRDIPLQPAEHHLHTDAQEQPTLAEVGPPEPGGAHHPICRGPMHKTRRGENHRHQNDEASGGNEHQAHLHLQRPAQDAGQGAVKAEQGENIHPGTGEAPFSEK